MGSGTFLGPAVELERVRMFSDEVSAIAYLQQIDFSFYLLPLLEKSEDSRLSQCPISLKLF